MKEPDDWVSWILFLQHISDLFPLQVLLRSHQTNKYAKNDGNGKERDECDLQKEAEGELVGRLSNGLYHFYFFRHLC